MNRPPKETPPKAWRRIEGVSRKRPERSTARRTKASPLTPEQRGRFWQAVLEARGPGGGLLCKA